MAGTMSLADLVADLKSSLHDAADVFTVENDGDFVRMLGTAALELSRVRPLQKQGSMTLVADVAVYDAPAGACGLRSHLWGISPVRAKKAWETGYPGRLPCATINGNYLMLDQPPTAQQIALLGAEFRFYYYALHVIGTASADTTINPEDRGLLLLRAQAEAMREMAMRGLTRPVHMRDGMSSQTRNGTPASLMTVMLDEFAKRTTG